MESLFSAFCRDKGIPEWVFQLSVLEKREKKEREEKASQEGQEGRKGRKEMEEWQNKRNTIPSVWSTEKPLHSLMSFLYHAFQGKFWNPWAILVVLAKVVPWIFWEILTGAQGTQQLGGLQKAVLHYCSWVPWAQNYGITPGGPCWKFT